MTQRELDTSVQTIGLTLTLFMVGFALGQFSAGPLSDRFGRRPPMLLALSAYTVSGIGCALAWSAPALVSWRFVQGMSAGACVVLAYTLVRDLYEGEDARAKRSYVTTFVGMAPVLAPSLGAVILGYWGWRPIYAILTATGLVLLATAARSLGETRSQPSGAAVPLATAYVSVLSNRRFLGPVIVNALSYGGIFAYIAGSAPVLIGKLSLSPAAYSAFFACTALALTAGALTSARIGRHGVGSRPLVWTGLLGGAVAGSLLAATVAAGMVTVPVVLVLLVASAFFRGLTGPNIQHLALEPMVEQAGSAAAAMGVLQILVGAAASAAVALLIPALGAGAMSHVMAVLALSALGTWIQVARPRPAA